MESGILNNWVTVLLNQTATTREYTSNTLLMDPLTQTLSDYPVTKEIMMLENAINSNKFNAFELHSVTKKNSLYFML